MQWDFTDVEMRNQAFKKIVAEKPFLFTRAHPCASWRSKSNASCSRMTQREKDDELHKAGVHMQFICRMHKLQHEEGWYFLHEHCQSELPWRKDCVEEIQEMTGAKLMSVSRGSRSLPSIRRERNVELNEKPTMMFNNSPSIAFASETKDTPNISRETSTSVSKTCMRIFPAESSCSTSGADSTSTFWPVWT